MSDKIKIGDKKIEVRGLTWGDKKALKEAGFELRNIEEAVKKDEMVEAAIRTVYGDEVDLDNVDLLDAYDLFYKTIKKTFLTGAEQKN